MNNEEMRTMNGGIAIPTAINAWKFGWNLGKAIRIYYEHATTGHCYTYGSTHKSLGTVGGILPKWNKKCY